MDDGPLRYPRCSKNRIQWTSPQVKWAVNVQLTSCSLVNCLRVFTSHVENGRWLLLGLKTLRMWGCVSAGLMEQLACWRFTWWCVSPLPWTLLDSGHGSKLVPAEVLKIASSPQSWTGPELIIPLRQCSGYRALYVDHGSATLHKWHVTLHVHIPNQQELQRYQKMPHLIEKLGSVFVSTCRIYRSQRNHWWINPVFLPVEPEVDPAPSAWTPRLYPEHEHSGLMQGTCRKWKHSSFPRAKMMPGR